MKMKERDRRVEDEGGKWKKVENSGGRMDERQWRQGGGARCAAGCVSGQRKILNHLVSEPS